MVIPPFCNQTHTSTSNFMNVHVDVDVWVFMNVDVDVNICEHVQHVWHSLQLSCIFASCSSSLHEIGMFLSLCSRCARCFSACVCVFLIRSSRPLACLVNSPDAAPPHALNAVSCRTQDIVLWFISGMTEEERQHLTQIARTQVWTLLLIISLLSHGHNERN